MASVLRRGFVNLLSTPGRDQRPGIDELMIKEYGRKYGYKLIISRELNFKKVINDVSVIK